jgi:hypothetical protein
VIADLKLVRDEAGNEYVALQGALLRASVKHYLSTDGTLWDSMPLKKELRDATFDMVFALVLIMNQVLSHATATVHDVRPCCVHKGIGICPVSLLWAPSLCTCFWSLSWPEHTDVRMLAVSWVHAGFLRVECYV